MPAILALVPWRLVGGVAVVLLVVGAIVWMRQTIGSLETENAYLHQSVADARAEALAQAIKTEELRQAAEREMQAVANSLEEARIARAELARRKGYVTDVPVAEDERAAAVLQRALECLREPDSCARDRGGEGESSGTAVDPGR
jgi:hypothetical protein